MTPLTRESAANMNDMLPSVLLGSTYSEGDADSGGDWYEEILDDGFDASEMSRENNNRCSLFHTIGYRDGIIAGKETSAQEGFNTGFLQSVCVGNNWGYVRGITSAFASLSESLKEKLVGNPEAKSRLEVLHESTQGISTNDALKIFYESILYRNLAQSLQNPKCKFSGGNLVGLDAGSNIDQLSKLSEDLQSVLDETPAVEVHSEFWQRASERD